MLQDKLAAEGEYGANLDELISGGKICLMASYQNQSGKRIFEWIGTFMKLSDELAPYLQPGRSPSGRDVLSVEKQVTLTLYFLKDQGSFSMTANTFGISISTVFMLY